jgi:hypothetical protein
MGERRDETELKEVLLTAYLWSNLDSEHRTSRGMAGSDSTWSTEVHACYLRVKPTAAICCILEVENYELPHHVLFWKKCTK